MSSGAEYSTCDSPSPEVQVKDLVNDVTPKVTDANLSEQIVAKTQEKVEIPDKIAASDFLPPKASNVVLESDSDSEDARVMPFPGQVIEMSEEKDNGIDRLSAPSVDFQHESKKHDISGRQSSTLRKSVSHLVSASSRASRDLVSRFSIKLIAHQETHWHGVEPYPWLREFIEEGKEFIIVSTKKDELKAIHRLVVPIGARPVLVHVLAKGDPLLEGLRLDRRHREFDRGNLHMGTTVFHTRNVTFEPNYESEHDDVIFEDLNRAFIFQQSASEASASNLSSRTGTRVSSISYQLGSSTAFRNMGVINLDGRTYFDKDSLSTHASPVFDIDYWHSKTVENARPYYTLGFLTMFSSSLTVGILMVLFAYAHYTSTQIENPWHSGFVRMGATIGGPIVYGYSIVVHLVFQCFGVPKQSPILTWGLISVFPILYVLLACIQVNDRGEYFGSVIIISLSVLVLNIFVSSYIFVTSRDAITKNSFIWMLICSISPLAAWMTTTASMIAYLVTLKTYPILAAFILSMGLPIQVKMFVIGLEMAHAKFVETPREINPKNMPGSEKHGQGLPVAFCLMAYEGFADVAAFMSVILGALDGASVANLGFSLTSVVVVNVLFRTGLGIVWVARLVHFVIAKLGYPRSKQVQFLLAPTVFYYLVMDMRYALSWSRFILFMSVFALRFLAYRNLTYDGYGQFAWSESVWITFWVVVASEFVEDVTCYFVAKVWRPDRESVFKEYWDELSSDPSKTLSTCKVYDTFRRRRSPLLRGVQEVPWDMAAAIMVAIAALSAQFMIWVIGVDAFGGPCDAVVDLSKVLERAIFHPGFNPTGECPE